VLEGELVRLRAPEPEDRARVHRWVNDPDVVRYLSMRYPSALADEVWLSDGPAGSFAGVRLAIETKEGVHIGAINLHRVNPEDRKAGLGIIIGEKAYWSNGYGADAVRTMVRFAFDEMNLNRVWLRVRADHEAGISCYRTCGFVEEARQRDDMYEGGAYHDSLIMGALRSDLARSGDGAAPEGAV
jgi:RimJ/RimL family protein N-acetyltransferase